MKNAAKSITLQRVYLERLFTTAARQGKSATIIITFGSLVLEGRLSRDHDDRT